MLPLQTIARRGYTRKPTEEIWLSEALMVVCYRGKRFLDFFYFLCYAINSSQYERTLSHAPPYISRIGTEQEYLVAFQERPRVSRCLMQELIEYMT